MMWGSVRSGPIVVTEEYVHVYYITFHRSKVSQMTRIWNMAYKYKEYLETAITILVTHEAIQRHIHSYTSYCQLILFIQHLHLILSTYAIYITLTSMSNPDSRYSSTE
jgi:hypothetical protein